MVVIKEKYKKYIAVVVILSIILSFAQIDTAFAALSKVGDLPSGICATSAATAPNGQIYIFGGENTNFSNEIREFYPVSKSLVTLSAKLPTARSFTAAACGVNGKIYVFGGNSNGGPTDEILEFDPEYKTISIVARFSTPKTSSVAVAASNGKIYVFGGYNGSYSDEIIEFDPVTKGISNLSTKLPTGRALMSAVAVSNGKIYVFGGYNGAYLDEILEFDPISKNIQVIGTKLPEKRAYTSAATEANGNIYIFGGWGPNFVDEILEFDPTNQEIFLLDTKLISPRNNVSTATAQNGNIYIFGGQLGATFLTEIMRFVLTVPPPVNIPNPIVDGNKVILDWPDSTDAKTYIIKRSKDGVNYDVVKETSDSRYVDENLPPGDYYYKVEAKNASGTSDPSNVVHVKIKLGVPVLSGHRDENNAVLSWTSISEATGYILERSLDGINYSTLIQTAGTNYTDTNLLPGTYKYRVKAKNETEISDPSNVVSITVPLGTPSLTGYIYSNNINLSWGSVTAATGYILERSIDDGSYSVLTELAETSYTDASLSPGIYSYRVKAKNSSQTSGYSNSVSFEVIQMAGLKAKWLNGKIIEVEWTKGGTEFDYDQIQLWRKDGNINLWYQVKEVRESEIESFIWNDDYLATAINYKYQIRGYNSTTWEWEIIAESDWATGNRPLAAPGGLKIISKNDSTATISWSLVEGATTYIVSTSTDGSTWIEKNVTGTSTVVSVPCQVKIRAGNHTGCQWSGILTVQ